MKPVESDRGEGRTERAAPIGQNLGKYRLLASIGRGGMGEVYLAMSQGPAGFKKLVVLKCMHADSADDESLRTMFLEEAMLAARLSHHNVVQTYEAGELEGLPYIAMEYLEGQPLSRLTRVVPVMEPRLAAHLMSEVLAGLHYAHQLKDFDGTPLAIVHRDLSPPNIFVTYDGVVKVVDFGIAKTSLASRVKTDAGTFKGKISYMAPEQAMREEIDRRADLFSAGAVLWELVAGKRLFREVSPALTLKRLLHDEIPSLGSERADVDPAFEAIVRRALQRNPADRYATALEMRKDLLEFVRGSEASHLDAELAALMSEKFSRHRQKVQRQVQLCLAGNADGQDGLPSVSLTDSGTGRSGTRFVPLSLDATMTTATIVDSSPGGGALSWSGASALQLATPARLDALEPYEWSEAPQPKSKLRKVARMTLFGALFACAVTAGYFVFSSSQGRPHEVHARAAAPLTASLEVVSSPPGAMVFVNGEPSGLVTPAVLKGLQPGRRILVRLDKAGYRAMEESVEIAEGAPSSRSFRLLEADGELQLLGAPAGARIYVDDVALAEDVQQPLRIPVGTHRLRVETKGALLLSRTVEIGPGEQTIHIEGAQGTR